MRRRNETSPAALKCRRCPSTGPIAPTGNPAASPAEPGAVMSVVTLAQASMIVDTAIKKGREINCAPLTVAVLDAGGHLVAFKREDKSGLLRFDIAFGKAWGALGMGFGSRT